jgi:hypothetical protein
VGLQLDKSQAQIVARRNLLTYTEQFDNAIWVRTGLDAFGSGSTANATTAPDGTTTADFIRPGAVSSTQWIRLNPAPTQTAQTLSAYVKASGYTKVALKESVTTGAYASFDLSNGTVLANTGGVSTSITALSNSWYRISMTLASPGSCGLQINVLATGYASGDPNSSTFSGDGVSGIFIWGAQLNTGALADYQRVTVPEGGWMLGNHRYQTTTGSKPILRGTPVGSNLVTNGDFASGTGWTLNGAVSVSGGKGNYTAATAGNNLQWTGNGGASGLVIGRVYRVQFTIDSISAGALRSFAGAGGVTRTTAGTYVDYITAATTELYIGVVGGTATTAVIDGIIVHDVTADAVTAPYGLQYDGIDDFLTTASVDFTATDKMAVVMGVRKLSDASTAVVVELSATSDGTAGAFALVAPFGGNSYGYQQRGSAAIATTSTGGFPAPDLAVIGTTGDIAGDAMRLRRNGTQIAQNIVSDQGTGNFVNAALFFGRRNGASLPYNGLDFGGVCIGKTLTATQLANVEKWVAIRTGVSL